MKKELAMEKALRKLFKKNPAIGTAGLPENDPELVSALARDMLSYYRKFRNKDRKPYIICNITELPYTIPTAHEWDAKSPDEARRIVMSNIMEDYGLETEEDLKEAKNGWLYIEEKDRGLSGFTVHADNGVGHTETYEVKLKKEMSA